MAPTQSWFCVSKLDTTITVDEDAGGEGVISGRWEKHNLKIIFLRLF